MYGTNNIKFLNVIVDDPMEIWTKHPTNTVLQRYRYTNAFDSENAAVEKKKALFIAASNLIIEIPLTSLSYVSVWSVSGKMWIKWTACHHHSPSTWRIVPCNCPFKDWHSFTCSQIQLLPHSNTLQLHRKKYIYKLYEENQQYFHNVKTSCI
jgi:hypothetical protein